MHPSPSLIRLQRNNRIVEINCNYIVNAITRIVNFETNEYFLLCGNLLNLQYTNVDDDTLEHKQIKRLYHIFSCYNFYNKAFYEISFTSFIDYFNFNFLIVQKILYPIFCIVHVSMNNRKLKSKRIFYTFSYIYQLFSSPKYCY